MARIIDITSKLSNEKPQIQIGDAFYPVDNSMYTVLKFEELASTGTKDNMIKALEVALGKPSVKLLDIEKISIPNFKVLNTAILAAMQDISYEEAEARFQTNQ